MKRLAAFVLALAACKGGTAETDKPAAPVVTATSAIDDKQVVMKLVELARKPDEGQVPQAGAYVAEERDDITLRGMAP
jgi:hypothetical protein